MLPISGHRIAHSLQRNFGVAVSRSFSAVASGPLTDPLEDDAIIPPRRPSHNDLKVSKLENGLKVASCDNGGGVSRIIIAVQGGSRFESPSKLGISHVVKNAAFLSNQNRTNLRTVRETQQAGGSLQCSNSRELISRKTVFLRNKLPEMLENIAPGIAAPKLDSWEIPHVLQQCKSEIATLDETAINLELLHKLSFRDGLGNSIYCDKLKVNNFSEEDIMDFMNQYHVGEGITIVGNDVDHDELMRYCKDLFGGLPVGNLPPVHSQSYRGGEVHLNTSNGFTYASLVGNGAGLSHADLPVCTLLQNVLGTGPYIKWGSHTVSSRLNKAVKGVTQDPLIISSLNISYSDAGLFGIHAVSTPQSIAPVLKSAVNDILSIAEGNISPEELERAKNQTKASILMLAESSEESLDDMVRQIIFKGSYITPMETIKQIDDITVDNIIEVAGRVFSKPTLAITGDSCSAPYLDDMF